MVIASIYKEGKMLEPKVYCVEQDLWVNELVREWER